MGSAGLHRARDKMVDAGVDEGGDRAARRDRLVVRVRVHEEDPLGPQGGGLAGAGIALAGIGGGAEVRHHWTGYAAPHYGRSGPGSW